MQDPAPLAEGLEATTGGAAPAGTAPVADDAAYVATVAVPGYHGPDRRRIGPVNTLRRAFYGRSLTVRALQVGIGVAVLAAAGVAGAAGLDGSAAPHVSAVRALAAADAGSQQHPSVRHAPVTTTPPTTAPPTAPSPTTASPAAPSPTTATPAVAPPAPAPAPAAAPAATPQQLGAEALTLVRYPWQRIPGYSIQFLPISDAPSPGFYGNTSFTWGQAGGTSTLYVYPGETVQQLAGITAFEIGHEVDAAAVDPQGGHTQIENILGIHPASWAPNCDCAEQNFLSGWYAAAFSDYWSPGVGQWSNVAPMPTGATLTAVEPWLNPTIG